VDFGYRKQIQYEEKERRMSMKRHLVKVVVGSVAAVMGMANIVAAANVSVGVDVNTPNARVQVGTPAPPPPHVTVVERERVIVREKVERHDNGKHKGHYKKHKKKHKED
jgi:hypothetical protein